MQRSVCSASVQVVCGCGTSAVNAMHGNVDMRQENTPARTRARNHHTTHRAASKVVVGKQQNANQTKKSVYQYRACRCLSSVCRRMQTDSSSRRQIPHKHPTRQRAHTQKTTNSQVSVAYSQSHTVYHRLHGESELKGQARASETYRKEGGRSGRGSREEIGIRGVHRTRGKHTTRSERTRKQHECTQQTQVCIDPHGAFVSSVAKRLWVGGFVFWQIVFFGHLV
jgi:hypothetical protein